MTTHTGRAEHVQFRRGVEMPDVSRAASAVLSQERRRCETLRAGDAATLAGLLSDRLIFGHANAVWDDKASLLAKIEAGTIIYHSLEVSEERVVELEGATLLLSRLTADVTVAGRNRSIDNRTLSVWANEQGTWRLLAYQPTPIPAA